MKCKYLEVSVRIRDILSIAITDINLRDFRDQSFSPSALFRASTNVFLSVDVLCFINSINVLSLYVYKYLSEYE